MMRSVANSFADAEPAVNSRTRPIKAVMPTIDAIVSAAFRPLMSRVMVDPPYCKSVRTDLLVKLSRPVPRLATLCDHST
jgi:hypothetical protein